MPDNLPELGLQAYLALKVFGPPAGVVGDQLAELARTAGDNVRNVAQVAVAKLGDRVDEPGSVSARSLVKTFQEAAVSHDEVVAEYLGGVLASSRSEDGEDDRSVAWSALIGRLSSDQLRLHYALYGSLRQLVRGESHNLAMDNERKRLRSYVGFGDLFVSCGWWSGQHPATFEPFEAFAEAFDGLMREGLVDADHKYGGQEDISGQAPGVDDSGLVWIPSVPGIRLFLWGQGLGGSLLNAYLDEGPIEVVAEGLILPENAQLTSVLAAEARERQLAESAEGEGHAADGSDQNP